MSPLSGSGSPWAFYLVAVKLGTVRAGEIWIGALRQIKAAGRPDFPSFARILHTQAGKDAGVVGDALKQVGLDPTAAPATS